VLNKKFKFFLILFTSLIFVFIIIYRLTFYIPPLLDLGKRNFIEKSIDFISFGWHFTKASIYRDYLKNSEKANKELGKAGWYREEYLIKYFGVKEKDFTSILEIYKQLKINSISEKLDAFLLKEQKKIKN